MTSGERTSSSSSFFSPLSAGLPSGSLLVFSSGGGINPGSCSILSLSSFSA
ncbi:MAG TPA: hypothetical protein VLB82_11935 [Thermodesulfobacteriota bacterium]|nr:hypothetical protein [Thermodesulfobacteriota bacterium]